MDLSLLSLALLPLLFLLLFLLLCFFVFSNYFIHFICLWVGKGEVYRTWNGARLYFKGILFLYAYSLAHWSQAPNLHRSKHISLLHLGLCLGFGWQLLSNDLHTDKRCPALRRYSIFYQNQWCFLFENHNLLSWKLFQFSMVLVLAFIP